MFETHEWKCPEDSAHFKKIVETKYVFKFLMGLDKSLDEVRGRNLRTKPLPSLREAFSEVRREESRKCVMLGQSNHPTFPEIPALVAVKENPSDQGAFATRTYSQNTNRTRKGHNWCDHCQKPGHLKDTCWKLHGKPSDWKLNRDREDKGNAAITEVPQSGNSISFTKEQLELLQQLILKANINTTFSSNKNNSTNSALHAAKSPSSSWMVDSGASNHMTGDRSLFTSYSPCNSFQTVRIANGTCTKVVGTGIICLSNKSVLCVPDLDCNLILVSSLNRDLNCETKFLAKSCVFQDFSSGKTIGSDDFHASLYVLDVNTPSIRSVSHQCQLIRSLTCDSHSNKESEIMMWHFRLGHPNFLYLKILFPSLFINKNPSLFHCEVCQLTKHTQKTYSSRPYKPSQPFSLIHDDIWGPFRIPSITGHNGFYC